MPRRRLTKGEFQKLLLFGLVLFAAANVIGFSAIHVRFTAAATHVRQLEADRSLATAWMESRDLWTKRRDWMAAKQPKLDDVGQANVTLLDSLHKSASADGLTVLAQTLKDPSATPTYREVSVQFGLTGSLDGLCRWMVEVQQPELFQAVTSFSLRSEGDDGKIRCELTVARWYAAP
jgi:hypothetical protein